MGQFPFVLSLSKDDLLNWGTWFDKLTTNVLLRCVPELTHYPEIQSAEFMRRTSTLRAALCTAYGLAPL